MDRVANYYGFHPNRAGYIRCPFHREKTPSLKIYPGRGGWHCFGCCAGGSVIDFVMKLFDITFPQAVIRLSSDFGLDITPRRRAGQEASKILKRRAEEEIERERKCEEYRLFTEEYRYWLEASKVFSPDTYDGVFFHPLWCEAVKRLPQLENWLDENIESGLRRG